MAGLDMQLSAMARARDFYVVAFPAENRYPLFREMLRLEERPAAGVAER